MPHVGRLRLVAQLAHRAGGFTLSVGSKSTRLANVNVDLKRNAKPDIVATVFGLPFNSKLFDTILFTDVIEHLPVNTEIFALLELKRCLKSTGHLILSTPNAIRLFKLLDPSRWGSSHRSYTLEKISELVNRAGLSIELATVSGGVWEGIGLLVYYSLVYPIGRILRREVPFPLKLGQMSDAQYDRASSMGYTIFVVCSPKTAAFGPPNNAFNGF